MVPKVAALADIRSLTNGVCTAVESVSSSLVPPLLVFFNLHPVASFAALSASSIPTSYV